MPSEKPTSARAIAADVLNQFDPKRGYASAILHKLLHKTVEKQRVTDLIFGALRNLAAIDMVIAKFTDCPIERIQTNVLNIIRTGAYELIYSPATPDYSIVNEAVKNAKALTRLGGAGRSRKSDKQVGFVNAALRQIARHITSRQAPLVEAISQRTLPQTPTTGCEFDTDILPDSPKRQRGEPDKKTSPADYLCAAFSLPKWLVTNWLDEYGTDSARQICFASNRRPSIYIRPNILKTTTQKLAGKLRQENIDCEILEGTMIKLKSPRDVTELPGFVQGEFSVQDITAAQAIKLLKPQPGWRILDLCAAPGTKTTQLAEATGNKAEIIATDIDSERLKMVNENISRLGLSSVKIFAYEELFYKLEIESRKSKFTIDPIDCVLLDVPCSNTGVLAKRIEVRYRITPKAIKALAETQAELLKTATSILKPNGKICYSTCSIQKQENQQLVAEFLKKNPDFELESEKLILPSAESPDCDGGYTAIILKKQA